MSPEQQARKTELQRQLINLRKGAFRAHSQGLLNRVFSTEADIRRIEEELLSIDPDAVLYRCWATGDQKQDPWRIKGRRKTDREEEVAPLDQGTDDQGVPVLFTQVLPQLAPGPTTRHAVLDARGLVGVQHDHEPSMRADTAIEPVAGG